MNSPHEKCNSILVVEDEKDIRETLCKMLKLRGFTAHGAANGQEGLELLKQAEKPCMIFLDLMMPVMNGWEFVEALKEDSVLVSIPVIIVSAFEDKADSIEHKKAFLKKPVRMQTLIDTASKYCNTNEGKE